MATCSLPNILIIEIAALFKDSEDQNVSIKVGQGNNVKTFTAHSVILRARSPYFKVAFSQLWARQENGIISMDKPNIRPVIFEKILGYIYTGEIILPLESEDILDILIAADELMLEALINSIQNCIVSEGMNWIKENFIKVQQLKKDLKAYYFAPKLYPKEKMEGYAPKRSIKVDNLMDVSERSRNMAKVTNAYEHSVDIDNEEYEITSHNHQVEYTPIEQAYSRKKQRKP
ncbi:10265_t:CDS:2 [Ambispora gerdemannii]|uniref:10265_t:CDS:1 n=1 Tax=Ambispora gerdemannii TaxID=144530 RepID=A0A9N9BMK7_9GLOM|nr:10265_t:CDS:2 [Ambispora gerdemannii]